MKMTLISPYRFLLLSGVFLPALIWGQIVGPSTPTFSNPFMPGNNYTGQTNIAGNNNRTTIEQNNLKVMQQSGGYVPPAIPPSDPVAFGNFMQQQYGGVYKENKKQQEIRWLLAELQSTEKPVNYYQSGNFKTLSGSYQDAFQKLNTMLSGQQPLSVKDAYYHIESAYGEPYLTKEEYDQNIKQSADFIRTWLSQNGYNPANSDHLHLGIQQFMKNELTITEKRPDSDLPPKKTTHLPFFYDYADFKGEGDFRNYFVTKVFATGGGQCNGLPVVYLVLAEALGLKTYLTFAPQHSFIKYRKKDGTLHNYEPTSGWNIADQWYIDNMFISKEAQLNKIYFDTLNNKQVVANCLIDLSFGYMQKFSLGDGNFSLSCLEAAQPYFPKGNNIYYYFMRSEIVGRMLSRTLAYYKISIDQVEKYPDAAKLYKMLLENEAAIQKLGYVKMPETTYQKLMEEHEFKGRLQEQQNINGKEKHDLFIETP